MRKLILLTLAIAAFALVSVSARAALEITITQGVNSARPIAVVPFAWQGAPDAAPRTDVAAVVAADLKRSGLFKPLSRGDMLATPSQADDIHFRSWQLLNVNDLVIGTVAATAQGYRATFRLYDVYTQRELIAYKLHAKAGELRALAHHVSNLIYHALTGQYGAFGTRIAYVAQTRVGSETHYKLIVSDADGYNAKAVFSSDEPILSPSWSPDGTRIAYSAFANHHPGIYVQTVATGQRQRVLSRPGLNGAPAFSPDGTRLAVVLSSQPGNPDIYILDLKTKALTRVTFDSGIETEPAWMPNGQRLVYTSNRGGNAQLYIQSLDSRKAQRLTFEGRYNADAHVAPDGQHIAMVHRNSHGQLHIGVLDLATGAMRVLTHGRLDKSPSVAPNGSMIIYSGLSQGKNELATVAVDGNFQQTLSASTGEINDPAWGPLAAYITAN